MYNPWQEELVVDEYYLLWNLVVECCFQGMCWIDPAIECAADFWIMLWFNCYSS